MTDAISGIGASIPPTEANASGAAKPGQTSGGTESSPVAGTDAMDVVQGRSLFTAISATAGAVPTVDSAKITAIRQSLADGTYSVDPQQIAKQLLKTDQSLSTAPETND